LIEGVKDYAIFMLDPQGYVVSWNTGAERIKGYRPDEIIGEHYSRFYRSDEIQDDRPSRHLKEAASEGKCESEGWRVRKDGSLFWASTLLAALRDENGQLRGFAKITRDTTELKEAHERALRAERLAAIGEMIAGLAHESRNALQRSQACLERLAWKVEDRPEAAELVARIRQAQRDLHYTFEEVRQYAAPVNLSRDRRHLGELLEETWDELAELRGARQARLDTLVANCDLHCAVDAFAIKQVLRNTLENSLSACPDPLEIHLCFSDTHLDGVAALQLCIRDNGPGLTAEQQCRIFEPFYTTKTRGTGLGMAIAKRVVEAHGGTIAATSSNASGAEIRISLPRR
jgi:two-component system sensor kinase FixL